MPQLPSGRHVAIGFQRLHEILGKPTMPEHQLQIIGIEHPDHILGLATVFYFRERLESDAKLPVSELGKQPPEQLQPYDSGFSLLTIQEEIVCWSATDRDAFIEWLGAADVQSYVQKQYEFVQSVRSRLSEVGPLWSRVTELWWEAGVHPLQTEEPHAGRGSGNAH